MINELRHKHALSDLLAAAGMARSTWYYNFNALHQQCKYTEIKNKIREIYHHHKGRYGCRRITVSLKKQGHRINHKTVQRLMAELSLKALIRVKKYRWWKGEAGKIAASILKPDFNAQKPDEKWVTDVTEFAAGGKKLCLSPIIDLFNGEVVSRSMSERPVMKMVGAVPEKAFQRPGAEDAAILHSDQGWQYQIVP